MRAGLRDCCYRKGLPRLIKLGRSRVVVGVQVAGEERAVAEDDVGTYFDAPVVVVIPKKGLDLR